jgi:hypothetical protein
MGGGAGNIGASADIPRAVFTAVIRRPSFQSHRGCWAGIAVLAASVVIGDILFGAARRDRLARRQLARYDGTLDDLLEPK